jgi:hypothetical protein
MKQSRFAVPILILLFLLVVSCRLSGLGVSGSGEIIDREEELSGFDEVEASNSFSIEISQGESYRVTIRIDDNLEQYLDVRVDGDRLKIGMDSGRIYNNATMEASITMPELSSVHLSGASDGSIGGFQSSRPFDAGLSGSSSLRGDIVSADVRLDLSGSSDVNLTGSGDDLDLDASGSSEVDLAGFRVVNASGRIDVDASGASDVYYLGSPTLGSISTSGASSVEER